MENLNRIFTSIGLVLLPGVAYAKTGDLAIAYMLIISVSFAVVALPLSILFALINLVKKRNGLRVASLFFCYTALFITGLIFLFGFPFYQGKVLAWLFGPLIVSAICLVFVYTSQRKVRDGQS